MRRQFLTLLVLVGLVVASAAPAGAAKNDRVTYGDVRAMFQTAEGGGSVAFQTGTPAMFAAPADIFDHSIRPFPFSPWDGRHVCEDDWQLLVLALFDGTPDRSYSHRDAAAILGTSSIELVLDGTVLTDAQRTALKRFKSTFNNDIVEGYWYQEGVFYAPGELAVGPHTFSATFDIPFFGLFGEGFGGPITFYVDASGTGVCGSAPPVSRCSR